MAVDLVDPVALEAQGDVVVDLVAAVVVVDLVVEVSDAAVEVVAHEAAEAVAECSQVVAAVEQLGT